MSENLPSKPVWYKNTYFWIAGILFLLGAYAAVAGSEAIRDPGQKQEGGLAIVYLVASLVMLVNGWISHRQTVQAFIEAGGLLEAPSPNSGVVETE